MNKIVAMLAVIIIASGCATISDVRDLSIGLNKKDVISIMGQPRSTRATSRDSGVVEIWEYRLARTVVGFPPTRDTYYLFFKENKLSQWGEENDWGNNSKDPDYVEKVIIQKQAEKPEPKFP